MLGVDVFEEREAAAAGKFEIEKQDIDGAVGEGDARGGDGVCGLRDETEAGGDLGAGVADGGIVVDDQDAKGRRAIGIDTADGGGNGTVARPGGGGGQSGGRLQAAGRGWDAGLDGVRFGDEHRKDPR